MTLEYDKFYLVNCYSPNSQNDWLESGIGWNSKTLCEYLLEMDREKPIILCGDLKCGHQEIDLKNPKTNTRNAGFSDEERAKFTELLDAGFTDSFRYLYPIVLVLTWWSYMFKLESEMLVGG